MAIVATRPAVPRKHHALAGIRRWHARLWSLELSRERAYTLTTKFLIGLTVIAFILLAAQAH